MVSVRLHECMFLSFKKRQSFIVKSACTIFWLYIMAVPHFPSPFHICAWRWQMLANFFTILAKNKRRRSFGFFCRRFRGTFQSENFPVTASVRIRIVFSLLVLLCEQQIEPVQRERDIMKVDVWRCYCCSIK